jgi:hypothetical protein
VKGTEIETPEAILDYIEVSRGVSFLEARIVTEALRLTRSSTW